VGEASTAGGSFQLVELIEEHGAALLYDLQVIGVDLRDLWRPNTGVTPRYVLWLVGQLPPESAFRASQQGGPAFRAWTPTLHVLVGVANLLNAANRQRAGKKTREPLIRPPSPTSKPKPRRISVAEIAARQKALEQAN
jgi:hypothetical protein